MNKSHLLLTSVMFVTLAVSVSAYSADNSSTTNQNPTKTHVVKSNSSSQSTEKRASSAIKLKKVAVAAPAISKNAVAPKSHANTSKNCESCHRIKIKF